MLPLNADQKDADYIRSWWALCSIFLFNLRSYKHKPTKSHKLCHLSSIVFPFSFFFVTLTLHVETHWNWGHWGLAREVATRGGSPKMPWASHRDSHHESAKMCKDGPTGANTLYIDIHCLYSIYPQRIAKVLTKCKSLVCNVCKFKFRLWISRVRNRMCQGIRKGCLKERNNT